MPDRSSRRLVLLGPQPLFVSLRRALQRTDIQLPVALITAGWQEEELDPGKNQLLQKALPEGSINLALYQRSESLFQEDPELIDLLHQRQDQFRHLRQVYNTRLDDVLEAARKTLRRESSLLDIQPERESAVEMVRQLDRQYFLRTCQITDEFEEKMDLANRPRVKQHCEEVHQLLQQVGGIVISGGHAGVILNRLRIFGILDTPQQLPIIAWSAGAMALADQVVLFHDSPPQGRGNAEVMQAGLSMFDRYLPLPDARRRLLLNDHLRVALFARRFNHYQCVIFDETTILERTDGQWWISPDTQAMTLGGKMERLSVEVPA